MFLLVTSTVNAHPGRTDSNGGHHCWTNCEKWGYETGEYHYHNDGNDSSSSGSSSSSNSDANQSSGKSSTGSSTSKPKPNPQPKVDEKQVKANQHYQTGLNAYNNANYRDAIDELEKIYDLDKVDDKTKELIQNSLLKIYGLAETAHNKDDFETAKEHLTYIQDHVRSSDTLQEKAAKLLEQTNLNEKVGGILSEAKSLIEEEEFESAIEELEKVYELKETDDETDVLIQKTLESMYEAAEAAFNKDSYENAKEYLIYIQDYVHASDSLKEKSKKLLKQIKINEEVETLLSSASNSLKQEEFEEAIKYIQDARELSDNKEIEMLYKEAIEHLTNYAEKAFQDRDFSNAISSYTLLIEYETDKSKMEEYQLKHQQLLDEQLIQENFSISINDLASDSLFNHLMTADKETQYDNNIESIVKSKLRNKKDNGIQFIFTIQLDDLFREEQDDAN